MELSFICLKLTWFLIIVAYNISLFAKRFGPLFEQTCFPSSCDVLCPSLVEIGSVILECFHFSQSN